MKEAKKIYILHGWAYSTEKWNPFIELLKKNGYDVTMLHIPGLTAPLEKVWDLENYVEWLKKVLSREKEKVILIGHSNGGRISLAFTSLYPEKVSQLILIDSAGIYHNELPLRIKRATFGLIAKVGKIVKNNQMARKLLYKFVREQDYAQATPVVRATMKNLIQVDLTEILPAIKVPTTIIWGTEDRMTVIADGGLMNTKITQSSLHKITGARHSPMFTHTEKVVDIITKELRIKN